MAFARAQDAVAGALTGQRALSFHDFGDGAKLRVRMGIHTGEPTVTQEGYVGPDVHLGSRICSVAWEDRSLSPPRLRAWWVGKLNSKRE
jgi:class 3 adenylate cyclase